MSWAAITASVIGAGLSAGVAAASQPGTVKAVDQAKSSRKAILADLKMLPARRILDRAAQLGLAVDYPTGEREPIYDKDPVWVPEKVQLKYNKGAPYRVVTPGYWDTSKSKIVGYKPKTKHADFRGAGQIDVDAAVARGTAEGLLGVQQKYGTQFVDEARKQQEAADPLGTAARKAMFDEINRIREGRDEVEHPVSDALDAQMMQELDLGRQLSPEAEAELARVLQQRAAGGDAATADVERELESNVEAEQRFQDRLQRGMGYLASGATPEDRRFREVQTDIANLAAALGGRTPQSQFASLAGGQQGATPQARAQALPQLNPNAGALGQQGAMFNYQQGIQQAANQVSPWFAGLSTAIKGAQVAGAAGWQPVATN